LPSGGRGAVNSLDGVTGRNRNQFGTNRRGKFNSKETTKNLKKRLSGASEEACELLSEAYENPESTPIHQNKTNILENDDKSEIIRKAIGELDSKDSTKLSNPYQLERDRRETRC